jgi:hypothetical protein
MRRKILKKVQKERRWNKKLKAFYLLAKIAIYLKV